MKLVIIFVTDRLQHADLTPAHSIMELMTEAITVIVLG